MSNNLLLLMFFSCCLMLATSSVDIDAILAQYQQSLEALWQMRQKRATLDIEARDDDCFVWYIKKQNTNMQTYREYTEKCGKDADAAKNYLTVQGVPTRYSMINQSGGICKDLNYCADVDDLLTFYACYNVATNENMGKLYNLSTEAYNEYNDLSVKYQNINAQLDACTATQRDRYIKDSAETDRQFQNCQAGGGLPDSTDSTTPDIITTTSTTATTNVK